MREIKFRAWHKDLKKMLKVDSISFFSPTSWDTIRFYKSNCIGSSHDTILMQFTGLKDKNGKEIYEGDIVLCQDDAECFPEEYNEEKDDYFPIGKYEVVYQAEQGYAAFELKDSPCEDMNGLAYACANSIEIIGNIYENPELLKGDPST